MDRPPNEYSYTDPVNLLSRLMVYLSPNDITAMSITQANIEKTINKVYDDKNYWVNRLKHNYPSFIGAIKNTRLLVEFLDTDAYNQGYIATIKAISSLALYYSDADLIELIDLIDLADIVVYNAANDFMLVFPETYLEEKRPVVFILLLKILGLVTSPKFGGWVKQILKRTIEKSNIQLLKELFKLRGKVCATIRRRIRREYFIADK